ncbi:DUF2442 domain-containing protein [Microbulbifer thermotolerans]|uniref:DUF2442 domain-containing protein n=1 Tax=Microbulbifer thermotolerans TaxID=252514 RepID=UPI0008EF30EC|nr:DUF2442 domain-containing protein [Microbulbifer thermotolerans]MCX2781527.1 DUF2442 domain-containing protein [Microbulbifer thermotolerans]MCX2794684.1 DUF2442 domain-containing protein [Microbulbifer thermotolerans]MCX2836459.1 DUF2442 domain-containing protein [Microbulbifer thermotolerans]SFC70619.1 Protein of unknown function [Microbulbifer thermotolerans]
MSELLVKSAKHKIGHILEIKFNDGHVACVDFAPFIFSNGHPDYEPYKSVENFLDFEIVDGNLNWDDYTMIFPVEDLYNNRLIKR